MAQKFWLVLTLLGTQLLATGAFAGSISSGGFASSQSLVITCDSLKKEAHSQAFRIYVINDNISAKTSLTLSQVLIDNAKNEQLDNVISDMEVTLNFRKPVGQVATLEIAGNDGTLNIPVVSKPGPTIATFQTQLKRVLPEEFSCVWEK